MADSFDLAAWVAASCEAQGVPVKVEDPEVIRRVCVLLRASESGTDSCGSTGGSRPVASEAPDRLDSIGVQGSGVGRAGCDDGVVEDCADDGVLSGEVERGPLVA